MLDKIYIRDLALRCIIGIYPEERVEKQDVLVNVIMECDLAKAAESDAIEDTVNYMVIKKDIMHLIEASEYQLIETMAERVAERCLADAQVERVTVTIDKPGALRFARSVAVEITRTR